MEENTKEKGSQVQEEHMEHFLIPKHRLLSDEEKDSLLKKYNTNVVSLPIISSTDIIAKQIGAKTGDIVEIKRDSATAGETFYYRYVVG